MAAWSDYMRRSAADAIFILGDLFEAWVGDDARHSGFEARCAEVLAEAATRRPVHFMVGNRDFLLGDEMLAACGLRGLADPRRWRRSACACSSRTAMRCASATRPTWPFAPSCANQRGNATSLRVRCAERRAAARAMRAESERHKASQATWHDVDRDAAVAALDAAHAGTLVHGHTHRPGDERWSAAHERRVLGDWDLDDARAPRAAILRWRAAGFMRLPPADAIAPPAPHHAAGA